MEGVPFLSVAERDDLIASLKEAEVRIAAGEYTEHNPETFVEELMKMRAAALRKRSRMKFEGS
jgi:hypothetical protein